MDKRLYIDIHVIQSVPPSCLNRDDTNSPKTAVYGGIRRARVSSQSWKKAMRDHFRDNLEESEIGVRTKWIVPIIADKIKEKSPDSENPEELAEEVLSKAGVKVKEGQTGALFFISSGQAEALADIALTEDYSKKDVETVLNRGHTLDIALFGRMVADNPALNADAASQVAHSISTHKVSNEYDYFTAVDERSIRDDAGAGMIGTIEFNSSTLYRYATIAVHDLFVNLNEEEELTAKSVGEFVKAFILSMPTGKQNTFANRTVPDAVMICIRDDQPVNLVNAFEEPVKPASGGGFSDMSIERLGEFEKKVTADYVSEPVKICHIGRGLDDLGPSVSMDEAVGEVEEAVRSVMG